MQSNLATQLQTTRFLGVNLRQNRMTIADEDLAKSINADLHAAIGSIWMRLGREAIFGSALADTDVRTVARISTRRYQVAGRSLYRAQTKILDGILSANKITTLAPFRPLNETTTWMFLADDDGMYKDDGTNLRRWGMLAPTGTPTVAAGAAGGLTGPYKVRYTFARLVGSNVVAESNPSTASSSVTLAAQVLSVSAMNVPNDPQVTHLRLYRTAAGGDTYLFDQNIVAGTTTATSSQADTALTDLVEVDNDSTPVCSWIVFHQEHAFLCRDTDNPHYLWYSKRFKPEQVPTDNFLEIGNPDDPLQCAVPTAGLLGVFAQKSKYRVVGNDTSGFVAYESVSRRGTRSPFSTIATPQGVSFVAKDGIFITDFTSEDMPFGDAILPIFFGETVNEMSPINWDYADTICCIYFKNRFYFAYPSGSNTTPDTVAVYSNDTKRWYFYQYATNVRSFVVEEDLDQVVHGSVDGQAYIMETGTNDGGGSTITMTVEKDFGKESPNVFKLFQYATVDAELSTESMTITLYVDETLMRTTTITGARTNTTIRFPEQSLGFRARMKVSYTGTTRIKMHNLFIYAVPLTVV